MKPAFVHGPGATGRVLEYPTEHFPGSIAVTLPGHPDGVAAYEPFDSRRDGVLKVLLDARL